MRPIWLLPVLACGLLAPVAAAAQGYQVITTCGTAAPPAGNSQGYMDATGNLCTNATGGVSTVGATATTAVPSYTNATNNALSQTLSGGLRVQLHMGSTDLGLGQTTSAGSIPVVIASDQSAISATAGATATTASPSYVNATANALSQTLTGGLRVQLHMGASDLSLGQTTASGSIPVVLASDQSTLSASISFASVAPYASAALEATHVIKASNATLYSIYASNLTGGAAGFLQVFNSTTVPGDGAVTPLVCVPFSGGTAQALYSGIPPAAFSTGLSVAISSATSCFSKTTGTLTGFISVVFG